MSAVEKLVKKINHEYEAMRERWWDMTADELISCSERITAAKFVKVNISKCVSEDEAEYFLKLKSPLEALMESVIFRYDPWDIAERENFRDILVELFDKQDLDGDYELEEADGMTMQ